MGIDGAVQSPESTHSGFGEGVPHSGLMGTHSSPRKAPSQDLRVVHLGPRGIHSSPRDAHSNPKGAYSSPGDAHSGLKECPLKPWGAHSGLKGCPLKPQGFLIARRCQLRAQRGVHLVSTEYPFRPQTMPSQGWGMPIRAPENSRRSAIPRSD